MTSDPSSILALSLSPGVGCVTVHRALAAARASRLPLESLMSLPLHEAIALLPPGLHTVANDLRRCTAAIQERARQLIGLAEEAGAQPLTISQQAYPQRLRDALGSLAPPVLFTMGDVALFRTQAAAVVGARDPSAMGARLATLCAETLCRADATVASGGARGVDSAAHEAALRAGGRTIVVLPQGLLTYRCPGEIQEAVQDGNALLVSEFPPDMDWETHAAVTRNATISALSRLVCVIEPKKTGGSIRTARYALDQGKRVLVYPAQGFESAAEALAHAGAIELFRGTAPIRLDGLPHLWQEAASDPQPPAISTLFPSNE